MRSAHAPKPIGDDKKEFLVFDLCGNFDFLEQEISESDRPLGDSLTTRIVKTRLALVRQLEQSETPDSDSIELRNSLLDDLHQHVATMESENILIRPHLRQVEQFSQRER